MLKKTKRTHEFRDPIHNFISVDRQERALIDTEPFQRLRQIHQLALTCNVYPGASHKRFEHSLGVMHLAGRVFDVVAAHQNRHPETDHIFPDDKVLDQWKTTLRLAALCHDLGHLPFSHAAEKQLLPKGQDHESLTLALIDSEYLAPIWKSGANIDKDCVRRLAVGSQKLCGESFSDWEAILSEIIIGDSFGVDRIDYLLRDSYHLGVSYGRFDHLKLLESLRILPKSSDEGGTREPTLGVEAGGLHSAEALLLARYFMYEQVYFHHVRRVYDFHLINFMLYHYGNNGYPVELKAHLQQTDIEIMAAMRCAIHEGSDCAELASRVLKREHFRRVYERNPSDDEVARQAISDRKLSPEKDQSDISAAKFIFQRCVKCFDPALLHFDSYTQKSNPALFPVLMPDGRIEESTEASLILGSLPLTDVKFIFAAPEIAENVAAWISANRLKVLEGA